MRPLSIPELMAWKAPDLKPIVGDKKENLLVPNGTMLIYGRWGTWKSMMMMDLGFKLAYGARWLNFETTRCNVLYLQIEVPQAIQQDRVRDYLTGNRIDHLPSNYWIASEPFYKVDRDATHSLSTALTGLRPKVLIIDPIFKVVSGDLNAPIDMTRVLDRCDEIRAQHNCAVVLVGHIRKPGIIEQDGNKPTLETNTISSMEHELIGSSLFGDWADTLISAQRVSDSRVYMTLEKTRHSRIVLDPFFVSVDRENLRFTKV